MSEKKTLSAMDELAASLGALQTETGDLAKSLEQKDDKKIVAAAGEGEGGAGNPEDEDDDAQDNATDAGKGKPFGKSFAAKDAEGNDVEAIDATEFLKSLQAQVEAGEANLVKAVTPLMGIIKQQGELLKSLVAEVKTLGGTGRGRKAVLTMTETPGAVLAKAEGDAEEQSAATVEEFFTKAVPAALKAGKISGAEANTLDVCRRQSWQPDEHLINKVLAK